MGKSVARIRAALPELIGKLEAREATRRPMNRARRRLQVVGAGEHISHCQIAPARRVIAADGEGRSRRKASPGSRRLRCTYFCIRLFSPSRQGALSSRTWATASLRPALFLGDLLFKPLDFRLEHGHLVLDHLTRRAFGRARGTGSPTRRAGQAGRTGTASSTWRTLSGRGCTSWGAPSEGRRRPATGAVPQADNRLGVSGRFKGGSHWLTARLAPGVAMMLNAQRPGSWDDGEPRLLTAA